jgi:hypothetical protein
MRNQAAFYTAELNAIETSGETYPADETIR